MRYLGSKQFLVVRRGIEFEKLPMNCEHMPTLSVVQRRRREMCEAINATLTQLAEGEATAYYPLVFPHGMNWLTGAMSYRTNIPVWWYLAAHIPFASRVAVESSSPSTYSNMLGPLTPEQVMAVAACLKNPSRLVLTCRQTWVLVQTNQPHIVAQLQRQYLVPAALLSWWGHFVYSEGPLYLPTRVPADEQTYEMQREQRWAAELAEEERADQMAGNREWVPPHFQPHEPPPPAEWVAQHQHPWEDEEQVFWRDAVEFYENAVDEALAFGARVPSGVIGSPLDNSFRLIYSSSEEEESDTLEFGN